MGEAIIVICLIKTQQSHKPANMADQVKSYASAAKSAKAGEAPAVSGKGGGQFQDRDKPTQVRYGNITAAKAVADAIRTSLGPKGMDKMIQAGNGDVTITNDGATILKQMEVIHPAAKMLVELSKAQDIEAGDGTTSVVVLAGSLLEASSRLLEKGLHPTTISDAFQEAATKCCEILMEMATPVDLADRQSLLPPMAVDAVLEIIQDPLTSTNVDLKDIKIFKKLGGTVDDSEMVQGVIFDKKSAGSGGVTRVEKAKVGLIQFCLSPPKTDMENNVIVSDYTQMDRVLREERAYILDLVKKVKKSGCNVLIVQKSILREAVNDMSLHFLAKMKILTVVDVEREDIDFYCKSLGCKPIASIDHMTPEMLGSAELVEEVQAGSSKIVKISGITSPTAGKTVSILLRGSNKLVLDEADRSLHDALCVIRCLVKRRALIAGGAPETEMSLKLMEHARSLSGMEQYCFRAFAEALEIIPYTLAENAGLNPIETVTDLRNRHNLGEKSAGINVRRGCITNILEENVVQPVLVCTTAISQATETVRAILKIDD